MKNHFIILSILFGLFFIDSPTNLAFAAQEKERILVINSYNHGYRWTNEVMEGFLSSFNMDDPNLDIRVEYMDTKNYDSPEYYRYIKENIKFKYENIKFKLIVVTDNAALRLVKEYREVLFADIPIVFCGIDHSFNSLIMGMTNITGVVEESEFNSTINLALSLHPGTNTLAVICDSSAVGQSDLLRFEKIKRDYAQKYKIIEILGWTEKELIASLKDLPQNTLVLRLNFQFTKDDIYLTEERVKDIWEQYCQFPTYTSLGHKVETGVLGGVITLGQFHGKVIADFAYKIFSGTEADSIPIMRESPTRPVFDYVMMEKFGITESDLPSESMILNKPFLFYEKYKNLVWSGIGVFLLLSLLILILFINIIMRKTAQTTLVENEKKYRTLVETVPQGILEVDRNFYITFANTALRKNFDVWDVDLMGKSIYEFVPQDQVENLRKRFKSIIEERISLPQYIGSYKTIKGKLLHIQLDWSYKRDVHSQIVGFISVVSDITQRIKAEKEAKIRQEQLIQADKMVALGTLVSGMAHEINNPNNFIMINIPIIRKVWKSILPILDAHYKINSDFQVARFSYEVIREDYFEICSNILAGTNRIKSIVNDLNEYSRKDVGELTENIAVNGVVTSCINLLGNNIKKYTNHLQLDLEKNLPAVRGNFQHFEQILINLIQNACQSLKSKNNSVTIKTCQQNGQVRIHIIDKGIGISKENLTRIFDPFYTTKRDEGGTGLGLSVSNSLIQKYKGELRFISIENEGTTAIVSFSAITK